MSIESEIKELSCLDKELDILRKRMNTIKDQRSKIEKRIIEFLKTTDQGAVKYKDNAILLDIKERIKRKGKKQKEIDIISVLESYGIKNSKNVMQDILQVQSGDKHDSERIVVKKIKNK